MSTRLRSSMKPPLPSSPIRSRRVPIQSISVQTPPGSLTKSERPIRGCEYDDMEIRPEYLTISKELRALAKKVREDLGEDEKNGPNKSPMFERGRFYDEYSARRNERLKRKKVEEIGKMSCQYNLGVNIESAKRGTSKKIVSARKSISSAISVERTTSVAPRYSLRSMSKENKKPPLPLYADKSMSVTHRVKKTQY